MKETDIAYIAGLFDGEAYIGIKRSAAYKCQGRTTPGYHARIQVRMVDEQALSFIAATFGGMYYKENRPQSKTRRTLYCWQASDKKAEEVLRVVMPYLRIKRAVAETVLALRLLQSQGTKHRTKVTGHRVFRGQYGQEITVANKSFSDEYVAECQFLWQKCSDINHGL